MTSLLGDIRSARKLGDYETAHSLTEKYLQNPEGYSKTASLAQKTFEGLVYFEESKTLSNEGFYSLAAKSITSAMEYLGDHPFWKTKLTTRLIRYQLLQHPFGYDYKQARIDLKENLREQVEHLETLVDKQKRKQQEIEIAKTELEQATPYAKQPDFPNAIVKALRSLHSLERLLGPNHTQVAKANYLIAKIYLEQKTPNPEKAEKYLDEALRISQELDYPQSPSKKAALITEMIELGKFYEIF